MPTPSSSRVTGKARRPIFSAVWSMIVLSVLEGIWMTHSGSISASADRTAALRWAGSLMAPPPRGSGAMVAATHRTDGR